jgi:magnesium transporter
MEVLPSISLSVSSRLKKGRVIVENHMKGLRPLEYTFNQEKWTWFDFDEGDEEKVKELVSQNSNCGEWFENIIDRKANLLNLNTEIRGEEYIWGSLIYQQDIEDKGEKNIFHFYIRKDYFITVNFDFSIIDASPIGVQKQMDQAENGIEGFFILLGEILSTYLQKIDGYEERLHNLLWEMKEQNNLKILERIYENRHELLVWKNLVVPIVEIKFIAEEAYGQGIHENSEFNRVETRVERIRMLLSEYQQAIDTMINLEEVVSTHRGNEIMKTLTVMTTLFTPVTAWGAVWGMNFKVMPELEWKLGYLFAGVLIIASTAGLYYYLKVKGWMGDILKVKKKNRFFG